MTQRMLKEVMDSLSLWRPLFIFLLCAHFRFLVFFCMCIFVGLFVCFLSFVYVFCFVIFFPLKSYSRLRLHSLQGCVWGLLWSCPLES